MYGKALFLSMNTPSSENLKSITVTLLFKNVKILLIQFSRESTEIRIIKFGNYVAKRHKTKATLKVATGILLSAFGLYNLFYSFVIYPSDDFS